MSTKLTPTEMEAMEPGRKIYDCDGDELTKKDDGHWAYNPSDAGVCIPTAWGPYTQVPPVDPADPDYDPKRHARR